MTIHEDGRGKALIPELWTWIKRTGDAPEFHLYVKEHTYEGPADTFGEDFHTGEPEGISYGVTFANS